MAGRGKGKKESESPDVPKKKKSGEDGSGFCGGEKAKLKTATHWRSPERPRGPVPHTQREKRKRKSGPRALVGRGTEKGR